MFHAEITNCLGFSLDLLEYTVVDGVRWYKVCSFLRILDLTNTTNSGTQKVPEAHKRRIETITIRAGGRSITTRPLYVTETGIWLMVMLGNNQVLRDIRERLTRQVLPRVTEVV